MITAIFMSPDCVHLAVEWDHGDGGLYMLDGNHLTVDEIQVVEQDWTRVGPK